jgi:hypothetical protein
MHNQGEGPERVGTGHLPFVLQTPARAVSEAARVWVDEERRVRAPAMVLWRPLRR